MVNGGGGVGVRIGVGTGVGAGVGVGRRVGVGVGDGDALGLGDGVAVSTTSNVRPFATATLPAASVARSEIVCVPTWSTVSVRTKLVSSEYVVRAAPSSW